MAVESSNQKRQLLGLLPDPSQPFAIRGLVPHLNSPALIQAASTGLISVASLILRLDVKLNTDQGIGLALENDPAPGTALPLNRVFKRLVSVAGSGLVPAGDPSDDLITTFFFDPDEINPLNIFVLVVDPQGRRITANVSWIVRGLL